MPRNCVPALATTKSNPDPTEIDRAVEELRVWLESHTLRTWIGTTDAATTAGPFHGMPPDFRAFISLNLGLTTPQAAAFLGVRPHSMENDRVKGRGPPFYRVGRSVRYALLDLLRFRMSQMTGSTSQQPR